jgi:hypothetical protein
MTGQEKGDCITRYIASNIIDHYEFLKIKHFMQFSGIFILAAYGFSNMHAGVSYCNTLWNISFYRIPQRENICDL